MHCVPAACASDASPTAVALVAILAATRDEEHAVSTTALGPTRPNTNDGRPTRKLRPLPVARYPVRGASRDAARCWYSVHITPRYTPVEAPAAAPSAPSPDAA